MQKLLEEARELTETRVKSQASAREILRAVRDAGGRGKFTTPRGVAHVEHTGGAWEITHRGESAFFTDREEALAHLDSLGAGDAGQYSDEA